MTVASLGLPDLDRILGGIRPGDNVVWKVDDVAPYTQFVQALAAYLREQHEPLIYFRFAQHAPILEPGPGVIIHDVDPEPGFESFITHVHGWIKEHGEGGFFVFDSLSALSITCYSDRMIGNFFRLTCPYLHRLNTIAYFAMYRSYHSYHAVQPISQTTQIMIDLYEHETDLYIQPSKSDGRQTPTMYMLHRWTPDGFQPVKSSKEIVSVINSSEWSGLASASYRMLGVWDKQFTKAEAVLEAVRDGTARPGEEAEMLGDLLRLAISKDEHVLPLAERYLTLADVIHIWKRMIGTGMIGGKAVGMLLARAILKRSSPKWEQRLEPHDSFYIGSDVYYTFLVATDCWWERQRQKDPDSFLQGNEEVRAKLLAGTFPDYIITRFLDMLDYFGQVPIIVRSSSLLEDNFGNAFSGKYESVFCANQGSREERLSDFVNAVRRIYASTISDDALSYRQMRGVLDHDEQMGLLVQRVSGMPYGRYFFPQLAGVAYSFNPYAWNKAIEPGAGLLRLVFGLGTRAVDRTDDDYTRVVSLSAPQMRPDATRDDRLRHAQRRVDIIDLERNEFIQSHFLDILRESPDLDVELVATRDLEQMRAFRESGHDERDAYVLTLDPVMDREDLILQMREMLTLIREAYGTHVDVEFTVNFDEEGDFTIHLLQCRPLQISGARVDPGPLPTMMDEQVIMRSLGGVIGHSRNVEIDRIIYVVPSRYAALPEEKRYALARLVGRLAHSSVNGVNYGRWKPQIMIVGPGRWGTSTPSLGIPVSFSEINTVSVLCEIDMLHEGLVPDLSLGTHFFNDLVEANTLYVGHFAGNTQNVLDESFFQAEPATLLRLMPNAQEWSDVVFVRDFRTGLIDREAQPERNGTRVRLYANAIEQLSTLYTTP